MTGGRTLPTATVGAAQHSNSVVLVTVAPGGELLDRRSVQLTSSLPTHPHHHEGSWAVGRYLTTPGARVLSLADAVALVERVRGSAVGGARAALEALAASVPMPISRIAIRACPGVPPTIQERITDHRAQTVADSVMYREVLANAAQERGWSVDWYEPEHVMRDAAAVLQLEDASAFLKALGQSIGPPWQAIHRLAAAAAIAASAACSSAARPAAVVEPAITKSVIQVDGAAMHVVSAGLENRKSGEPVVIFESGGSLPLSTWDPVLPAVSRFAAVVAYDRAGTGQSPWDSLPPTPAHVNARLQALLAQLRAEPPYILVGHSWGGALVRYFAGSYPAQVRGLLYLDPTDITQSPADELAVFESIGGGASARDAFYRIMEQTLQAAPAELRAEGAVVSSLMRSEMSGRGLKPAPDVPTSVIMAGKLPRMPQGILPFDTEAYVRATMEGRRARLRAWVHAGGTFVEAANAGHMVHADEPELVIETIRKLVQTK